MTNLEPGHNPSEQQPLSMLGGPTPQFTLRVTQVTGAAIIALRKTVVATGDFEELSATYRRVRTHNLCFGWWGFPYAIIWNIMALSRNRKTLAQLNALAASSTAAPGWSADPTGRHATRYWDGTAWTDQVTDVTTEAASLAT